MTAKRGRRKVEADLDWGECEELMGDGIGGGLNKPNTVGLGRGRTT